MKCFQYAKDICQLQSANKVFFWLRKLYKPHFHCLFQPIFVFKCAHSGFVRSPALSYPNGWKYMFSFFHNCLWSIFSLAEQLKPLNEDLMPCRKHEKNLTSPKYFFRCSKYMKEIQFDNTKRCDILFGKDCSPI